MKSYFKGLDEIWATAPTAKRDYRGFLNLSSNEILHPSHTIFVESWLHGVAPTLVSRYPYYPEIQERLAKRLGRSASEVWLVAGADEGIRILCLALGRAYGQVIASWPNYRGYARYCELAGIELQTLDVTANPVLHRPMNPSLVVLTDPDPVSGEILSGADRSKWLFAESMHRHLLFVDEAYFGFDGDGPFGASWATASLRTFSKSLGMAGLRLAAFIVPPQVGDYISRWSPSNGVSAMALSFLDYALDHEQEINAIAEEVARVREALLCRAAKELHRWRFTPSKANFVSFSLPSVWEAAFVAREMANHRVLIKTFDAVNENARMLRMTIADQARMDSVMSLLAQLHDAQSHG